MTIEFHTPFGKVTEKLVISIRKELLELAHINKKISRAEVMLKEDLNSLQAENKNCEIRLNIYGGNLYVHTRAESFEKSTKEALQDLLRLVREQEKKQKEIPGLVLSTVKIK